MAEKAGCYRNDLWSEPINMNQESYPEHSWVQTYTDGSVTNKNGGTGF